MPYIFNTPQDQAEMLEAIGVESIDQLFNCIPVDHWKSQRHSASLNSLNSFPRWQV